VQAFAGLLRFGRARIALDHVAQLGHAVILFAQLQQRESLF